MGVGAAGGTVTFNSQGADDTVYDAINDAFENSYPQNLSVSYTFVCSTNVPNHEGLWIAVYNVL